MKFLTSITVLSTIALSGSALAHSGHVAETAGHNHWIGYAIIGGLVLAACVDGLCRRLPAKA
jgi:hypothetical protein